jgi:acyl-CoA reductase-like NAD-dependent aldehyde dehydrogenase
VFDFGAAPVVGNAVIFKTTSDNAWSGRLLMNAFRAAGHGLPSGVLNLVSGSASAGAGFGHRLWHDELFLALVLVGEVDSLDEASCAPTTATTV